MESVTQVLENHCFGSSNVGQPIWAEEDRTVEFNSKRANSLSRFPSFFPVRVSPNVLTNQRSSKELKKSPKNDFAAKINSSTNDNLSNYSSSDSETEQKVIDRYQQ